MNRRRRQHNLTVLADGSVLATGGQSTNGGGGLVDLANAVYEAERWDPATGQWTELAPAAVARQYHSTALLLPDGRVLTGGGGICGACHQAGYLRRDQEIFTPPYLFRKATASSPRARRSPARRPRSATTARSRPPRRRRPPSARSALVRLGAPTHSVDQSQRYVPLSFTVDGTTLIVDGPNNPNEAPAGHYMLFAVDAAGVPSVSTIVQLAAAGPAAAAAPVVAYSGLNLTGRAQRFEAGAYEAARGNLGQVGADARALGRDPGRATSATLCRDAGLLDCVDAAARAGTPALPGRLRPRGQLAAGSAVAVTGLPFRSSG